MLVLALALVLVAALAPSGVAKGGHRHTPGTVSVESIEFIGGVTFPTGTVFDDTEVGGLSGIVYDKWRRQYYALSDDKSVVNPARYYTLRIDLRDGSFDDGDLEFKDVTFLKDMSGDLFAKGSLDPEGFEMVWGQLYIGSEEDATDNPWIARFHRSGQMKKLLPLDDKFAPVSDGFGVHGNLAFESLTATPNNRYLYAATEASLQQDGSPATLTEGSPARVIEYKLWGTKLKREFVYEVAPIPFDSDPPGIFADNGLVELQALDNKGTFLAMERSFAVGVGNTIRLFETSLRGATNVAGQDTLVGNYKAMSKDFVYDFEATGVGLDNFEGMAFGPRLADGRRLLIVVSDNNFNSGQATKFFAFAVELDK
jgi:3-phytase/alkaline phosphatase D